jgi:hypothetical protein
VVPPVVEYPQSRRKSDASNPLRAVTGLEGSPIAQRSSALALCSRRVVALAPLPRMRHPLFGAHPVPPASMPAFETFPDQVEEFGLARYRAGRCLVSSIPRQTKWYSSRDREKGLRPFRCPLLRCRSQNRGPADSPYESISSQISQDRETSKPSGAVFFYADARRFASSFLVANSRVRSTSWSFVFESNA